MRQKEAALGLVPGALSKAGSSKSGALVASSSTAAARLAAEDLYRDGNTLTYGDNKPSEDAIDRVVSKLNQEYVLSVISLPGIVCSLILQLSQPRQEEQILQETHE